MENRELPISFDESGSKVEHQRCDYTVRFICYDCRWTLDDCPFFLVTWQLLEELPPCSGSIGRHDCRHNFCFVVTDRPVSPFLFLRRGLVGADRLLV